MANEIPYDEFLRDIRRQKKGRKVEKPAKEPWEVHRETLSRSEYDSLTKYGRRRLEKPRPVWLPDKNRWTVVAPVNPVEWQILIRPEPASVTKRYVIDVLMRTCGQFRISDYAFGRCVSRLHDKRLLKKFGRSRIADKWLFPDLNGPRAGGEWHRNRILKYINEVSDEFGCFTYADRGYSPGVEMPDVITVKPQLVEHTTHYNLHKEPLK